MLLVFFAGEAQMVRNLFAALTLFLPALGALESVLDKVLSHPRCQGFSFWSLFGGIGKFSLLKLILLMAFLALDQVECRGIELVFKLRKDCWVDNFLDLIVD